MAPSLHLVQRKPRRVSQTVIDRLQSLSDEQGRSTSNLAAFLLETALDALETKPKVPKRWPSHGA